jgi:hypothetical protein
MPRLAIPTLALLLLSVPAHAQGDGYDWVTIGAANNAAYDGPDPFNLVTGRGSVSYDYRLSRTEVTTQQWLDFFNTFSARADAPPTLISPILWGAERDPSYTGPGTRYRLRNVPNAGMIPVGGVDWRTCAELCNWLCNNKSSSLSAIANGAYDTSTFGIDASGNWTDQLAHNPNARYWIPTLDEGMKAVHYDPNRNGPGQGGYWMYPNSSDTSPVYGPPGIGQANAGFTLPGNAQYEIPLGAYPNSLSPWGLLDTAGGTSEWMESVRTVNGRDYRFLDGSQYGTVSGNSLDLVNLVGDNTPYTMSPGIGFRIATAVPSPAGLLTIVLGAAICSARRSRRNSDASTLKSPRRRSLCLIPGIR